MQLTQGFVVPLILVVSKNWQLLAAGENMACRLEVACKTFPGIEIICHD
jgi:hypothetical protein